MRPTRDRRRQILDAALTVFLEKGYGAASIADIRARSGASTGSIYHFFASKEAIASALFFEAVEGWTAATQAVRAGGDIEAIIRSSVDGLIGWGLARPDLLRFMDEMRFLEPLIRRGPDLSETIEASNRAARAIYEAATARGEVRPLPWLVARALIFGPAYDFLRMNAANPASPGSDTARRLLSEAAWAAVRPG